MIETISSPRSVAPDPSNLDSPLTFDGLQSVFNKVVGLPYREGRKRPSLVSSTLSSWVTPSSAGNVAAARPQGPCKTRQRNSAGLSTRKKSSSGSADRRPIVDHTYRDHLHDPLVCNNTREQDSTEKKFTTRGGVTIPFPEKLHAMLSSIEEEDVVGWQPHGRAFLIRDKDRFVNEIMPKYFNQTKLTSFQRQLNLYGFIRLTAPGIDRGSYYHELFLRGRPDLFHLMQRTRIKGNGMKAAASPNTEPKFYEMETCVEQVGCPNGSVNQITCDDTIEEAQDADMTGEECEEEDSASGCLYEPIPVVSPSSSHPVVSPHNIVSHDDILFPFSDRPIWTKSDGFATCKRDVGPSLSKFGGFVGTKVDADIFSNQTVSLTSLISPAMFQVPRARLPIDFHHEDEWGLERNEDIIDCLDNGIMNEEVATWNDDDDDDVLSFAGIGIISDDRVGRMIDKYCNDYDVVATHQSK